MYGLGATLYHALSLELPSGGRTTAEILRRIEAGLAEPLRRRNPRLPRDRQTIVATAMNPEPARRHATADAMADDPARVLELTKSARWSLLDPVRGERFYVAMHPEIFHDARSASPRLRAALSRLPSSSHPRAVATFRTI